MSEIEESETKFIGRIYKIVSPNTDKVYIGSTIRSLNKRFNNHMSEYRKYVDNTYKKHIRSFDVIACGDASIVLLHERVFEQKSDMYRLEGEFIQSCDGVCNRMLPGRTLEEKRESQSKYQHDYQKTYYIQNKVQMNNAMCEYRKVKFTCPFCNLILSRGDKTKHDKSKRHLKLQAASTTSSSSGSATSTD